MIDTNNIVELASAATNLVAVVADAESAAPIPSTGHPAVDTVIAIVVPVLITVIKKLCTSKGIKVSKALWPLLTPALGLLVGQALCALLSLEASWVSMAKAGALAVFVRETLDQSIKAVGRRQQPATVPTGQK